MGGGKQPKEDPRAAAARAREERRAEAAVVDATQANLSDEMRRRVRRIGRRAALAGTPASAFGGGSSSGYVVPLAPSGGGSGSGGSSGASGAVSARL